MNAIKFYRIGNWFYRKKVPFIPKMVNVLIFLIFNSYIPSSASIGEGTKFAYGAIGVVLHNRSVIGKNCLIGSNVTIGGKSREEAVPVINDDVYISTGAKILGNVEIGSGSIIGASSVVLKDVPKKSVVVGIPGKIIRRNINFNEYV